MAWGRQTEVVELAAVTITPPTPQNIWEYLILFILSGGGVLAIKQFLSAYKSWKTLRESEAKRVELNKESAVERIVRMLQEQLDEQNEDFSARIADKDRYYAEELQRRSSITDENFLRKNQMIDELQCDNKRLRRLLRRYQDRYGYLHGKGESEGDGGDKEEQAEWPPPPQKK